MKKFITVSLLLGAISINAAYATNPMFGNGDINSIALYASQGTGSGTLFKLIDPVLWDFSPMTNIMLQYSQPMTIFRLPARMNFNLVQNFGYASNRGLSFFAAGISWDVALLNWHGWYLGLGIGPYMRDTRDRWVDSRLVFGEKFFVGKNISDNWRVEWFTLHFSNGNFTEQNAGFNYTGLSVSYSF